MSCCPGCSEFWQGTVHDVAAVQTVIRKCDAVALLAPATLRPHTVHRYVTFSNLLLMLGSYVHPETQEEILISADSRGYHWINAAAEERLCFDLNVEEFKLTPAEGCGHEIEVTFDTDDEDLVIAAVREGVTYARLIGVMETKAREEGVHLTLPEVERKAGGNIHAFICNVEDLEDWHDFSVLAALATNAHLNSGIPAQ